MIRNSEHIRPECMAEWHRLLAKYENFFKHADKDPTETIFFPAEITQCFLLDSLEKYAEMAHEKRPLFALFTYYLASTEPRLFKAEFTKKLRNVGSADLLSGVSKREFFQVGLPLFTKIEA